MAGKSKLYQTNTFSHLVVSDDEYGVKVEVEG